MASVRTPLERLGAGLTVRERDGECRRVSVSLQVHTIAGDPQWVVHLDGRVPPGIGLEVVACLVRDVRGEHLGLTGLEVVGLEILHTYTQRGHAGAVEAQTGDEGVEHCRRGGAEPGAVVGDDDAIALVAEQLARGDRDQQSDQREVEHEVAELAEVSLLRRDGDLAFAS